MSAFRYHRDSKLCGLALATMAMLAVVHIVALDVPWLRRLQLIALDMQIRLRGPQKPGPETVIVMIDDRTIAAFGRWPVPRAKLAELIKVLHRADAKTIGIDILLSESHTIPGTAGAQGESADDAALSQAIVDAGNVVLPFTFGFGGRPDATAAVRLPRSAYARLHVDGGYRPLAIQPTELVAPVPAFGDAAALGHGLVAYDVDGAPRYDYPALAYDLDHYPSMAIRAAQVYLGVSWRDVQVDLGRGIELGAVFVPTDREMRLLVNYLGPARTFPSYSMSEVLSGAVPDSTFANRIVLVGTSATAMGDTFVSPFTALMPGVERMATVIDSILHEHHLRRTETTLVLELILMFAAALLMGIAMSRLSLPLAASVGATLVAADAVAGQVAVAHGVWMTTPVSIIAITLTFTALLIFRYGLLDKEQRHIRRIFQRYLAPHMVDRLVRNQRLPELGGEQHELTVLFCDLRGFTALSERLDPATLTRLVNGFFTVATDAILESGGTIDKYLGDAIMAFWNAPIEAPNHAALACRAALRILESLAAYNASLAVEDGMPQLSVGIGINTGPCVVGNFGSSHRFDYSAIGDAVNIAARLEGETKSYGISVLIGPETAARVAGFATLAIDRIHPRGRNESLEIHALVGDESVLNSPAFDARRAMHAQLRAAALAADRVAARRLIGQLMANAPAQLKPLYDAYQRCIPWTRKDGRRIASYRGRTATGEDSAWGRSEHRSGKPGKH